MKRSALWIILTALAILALMADPASAQKKQANQTAMDGVITEIGGFSEFVAKYSDFNGDFAWLIGPRLGVTINDALWIGGAYYFKADNTVKADFRLGDRAPSLAFEYGGIDFEYIVAPQQLFHFSIQALLGYGGYSFDDPEGLIIFDNKFFYVLEPGLNLEMNVTDWLRFQWGLTFRILIDTEDDADVIDYRAGRQVQEYHFDANDLTNISFQFGLKFGGFN